MPVTTNTAINRIKPAFLEFEGTVNDFCKDYVPAILSFINPARIPGREPVPYREDDKYSEDQLGLVGDFYISKIDKPRKQIGLYELRCVAPGTKDVVIGKFSSALTAAVVSFCCGTRESKLFYLGGRVHHQVPYLWDIARLHRLSIFDLAVKGIYESQKIYPEQHDDVRAMFNQPQTIGRIIDTVKEYPPLIVTGASHIGFYSTMYDYGGYEKPVQDSDWVPILNKYFKYTTDCVEKDEDGNDAVQQALSCYNIIFEI